MAATLSPTPGSERIAVLDTTRGIAVLGILLMNIVGFGLPFAYEDPTNWGGSDGANLAAWRINSLLFEGTMRGLFTLLFGAGVILFLQRHASAGPDARPARVYFRRTAWLIVFGLVNGYILLWDGDILFYYGVIGLLLYFFRNLSAPKLIAAGALVLALQTSVSIGEYASYARLRHDAQIAAAAEAQGEALTIDQQIALQLFDEGRYEIKPTQNQLEYAVRTIRRSYESAFWHVGERTWNVQTRYFIVHGFGDVLGMMLLGMAFLKLGILTGAAPIRTYAWMTAIGYALGLSINAFEIAQLEREHFSADTLVASYLTYDAGRVAMTLGHVGAIMLLYRFNLFARAQRVLADVGRMALTNYMSQSAICMFLFTGAGLAWYGQLQRYELYYVVLAIWIAQLLWSTAWLRHFQQGPLEWLWRRLTYGRRRPAAAVPIAIDNPASTESARDTAADG